MESDDEGARKKEVGTKKGSQDGLSHPNQKITIMNRI